jgi:type VI secretion system protein ImpM
MNVPSDASAGFFGKVTSHGDFVSRRLPPAFVTRWDGWLQSVLQASRADLGPRWSSTYLSSSIWRFALAPGVCDDRSWAGLMMPSVDRVGRQFPLTIVASVAGNAPLREWAAEAGPWFDQLEALALWSLREDFSLEQFDTALRAIAAPATAKPAPMDDITQGELPMGRVFALAGLESLPTAVAQLDLAFSGESLWWTDGSEQVMPCLLHCRGLPAIAASSAMFDGQWRARGWEGSGAQ